MAKQTIGVGTANNDATGDTLRAAMTKVNDNFTECYGGQINPTSMAAGRFFVDSNVLNTQTGTSYTLVTGDNGKVVTCNNAGAITITLPTSLPIGYCVSLVQLGAGQVTVSPSSTTMRHPLSHTKTSAQYATINLFSHATNDFILSGDTA